jgi:hypothetical protein
MWPLNPEIVWEIDLSLCLVFTCLEFTKKAIFRLVGLSPAPGTGTLKRKGNEFAAGYFPFGYMVQTLSGQINKERVNDAAKLMMHRLIARKIGRDPSLVEKARVSLGRSAERFRDYAFVREWNDVLDLPLPRVRQLLTSRDEAMTRLRLSSPFVVTDGIDLEDEALRRRIWRAAKRIAVRSTTHNRADLARLSA